MPRRLLKRFTPDPQSLQGRWFLRPFGARLSDPQLWTLHRRGVTYAFGAGLAVCFVPLPVHLLLACTIAVLWRLNVPVAATSTLFVNPFTIGPLYYLAYRIGAALLHTPRQRFHFIASWNLRELARPLAHVWEPFLLGCLVCSVAFGLTGWFTLEVIWRRHVTNRYRSRHTAALT
jgi:uncharacterized protein (DUF2062 family)